MWEPSTNKASSSRASKSPTAMVPRSSSRAWSAMFGRHLGNERFPAWACWFSSLWRKSWSPQTRASFSRGFIEVVILSRKAMMGFAASKFLVKAAWALSRSEPPSSVAAALYSCSPLSRSAIEPSSGTSVPTLSIDSPVSSRPRCGRFRAPPGAPDNPPPPCASGAGRSPPRPRLGILLPLALPGPPPRLKRPPHASRPLPPGVMGLLGSAP
mmetsp:Transcript_66828/g.150954  ORF Transcript_66828/g.150954 Transcript_66828/m.150954 type:complete len:212 (-) Transcript_66828:483-1118(-)